MPAPRLSIAFVVHDYNRVLDIEYGNLEALYAIAEIQAPVKQTC